MSEQYRGRAARRGGRRRVYEVAELPFDSFVAKRTVTVFRRAEGGLFTWAVVERLRAG